MRLTTGNYGQLLEVELSKDELELTLKQWFTSLKRPDGSPVFRIGETIKFSVYDINGAFPPLEPDFSKLHLNKDQLEKAIGQLGASQLGELGK